ncbi:GNAT family N-acetyltransferase [Cephaloticoccus primus]|uniref:GNAT family N-acetyltransferase n=1 Tax=Cephaloticoccus primus TaxID=1548207 RepID=UPI0009EDA20B|nr:GNAT family protein [Cephaloticoccus primus]
MTAPMTAEAGSLPIGAPLPDWQPLPLPARIVLEGRDCRLEPLDPARHSDALWAAYSQAPDARDWTYLPIGPFADAQAFRAHIEQISQEADPLHFAVVELRSGSAVGTLALMRQQPQHGVIEVGWVVFSPALQRSRISTEAQFLLMTYVFDRLGYRRYEWKCDSLNRRSRKAAQRLGFQYEGTFRQAIVYKERSRDTAWFAIIDKDWPVVKAAFQHWLEPGNFDAAGQQRRRLQEIRESLAGSLAGAPVVAKSGSGQRALRRPHPSEAALPAPAGARDFLGKPSGVAAAFYFACSPNRVSVGGSAIRALLALRAKGANSSCLSPPLP